MISTAETEPHLEAALADVGFDHAHPDTRLAWQGFREFAAVPVSVAEDAFLFQCGVFDFTGRELFHWNLTRQFTHEDEDEGIEQLSLTLHFEPTAELRALQASHWSHEAASFVEWCAQVEALAGFRAAMDRRPVECTVVQEHV